MLCFSFSWYWVTKYLTFTLLFSFSGILKAIDDIKRLWSGPKFLTFAWFLYVSARSNFIQFFSIFRFLLSLKTQANYITNTPFFFFFFLSYEHCSYLNVVLSMDAFYYYQSHLNWTSTQLYVTWFNACFRSMFYSDYLSCVFNQIHS